jgi:hypothetical protein
MRIEWASVGEHQAMKPRRGAAFGRELIGFTENEPEVTGRSSSRSRLAW